MKNLIGLILFLFFIGLNLNSYAQNTIWKTSQFKEYDQSRSYKGIPFGTSYSLVNSKLNLVLVGNQAGYYYIKNDNYLKWDSYKFKQGFAGFTGSGQLYQINLLLEGSYSSCLSIYNTMRSKMISMFGLDNEYDTKKKSDPKSVSWDGERIYIWLTFNPNVNLGTNEGITTVSLTIGDVKLNQANLRSISKDENGISVR